MFHTDFYGGEQRIEVYVIIKPWANSFAILFVQNILSEIPFSFLLSLNVTVFSNLSLRMDLQQVSLAAKTGKRTKSERGL